MKKFFFLMAFILISNIFLASAITDQQKQDFDKILTPIVKIYDFLRYFATVVASLFLVYAGITYIISTNDVKKREYVKLTVTYIIMGLILIWAAPYIVEFLLK